MTYREELTEAMTRLGEDHDRVFIGYGIRTGKAMGTLAGVNPAQLLEFPVAEGLMMSAAIGMALAGKKPVVYIERMDFLLNAADALVNHLDKLEEMSRGEFKPGVIIRCTVGNRKKPLFTGLTHTQDFTKAFSQMLSMVVLTDMLRPRAAYGLAEAAQRYGHSTLIVEQKDEL